ncbi:MAG: hypothetical protein JW712_03170 [Dehalococcoidales bacterium]|nr:hypothetical protein [Dehalococcoidales bacterium]
MDDDSSLDLVIKLVIPLIPLLPMVLKGCYELIRKLINQVLYQDIALRVEYLTQRGKNIWLKAKIAYVGENDLIVETIDINSYLIFSKNYERIQYWVKIIIGYLTDDREGLKNVIGNNLFGCIWIFGLPVHRIRNRYLRKPISVILGIILLLYCLYLLINPIGWLFLWIGPLWQIQLEAKDRNVKIMENKIVIKRPFKISNQDKTYDIIYAPKVKYAYTYLDDAKYKHVKTESVLKWYRLPKDDQFTLYSVDHIHIKITGKFRKYKLKLISGPVIINLI